MGISQKHPRLMTFLFILTVTISSGFFLLEVINYVGTIKSTRNIHLTIVSMEVEPVDDVITIKITFSVLNPTLYSRVTLEYIYYQIFLSVDGSDELICAETKFIHDILTPNKEKILNATLTVPKTKNALLDRDIYTEDMNWLIKCLIHIETPIKKYYETIDITMSTSPPRISKFILFDDH